MGKYAASARDRVEDQGNYTTAETRDVHTIDQKLRAAGWCIRYRVHNQEPLWSRGPNGPLVPQTAAVRTLPV